MKNDDVKKYIILIKKKKRINAWEINWKDIKKSIVSHYSWRVHVIQ